jgi:hypothetical protein
MDDLGEMLNNLNKSKEIINGSKTKKGLIKG